MGGALKATFSNEKIVDSKLLNAAGLQVIRSLLAKAVFRTRKCAAELSGEDRDRVALLERDGMLMIPGFLPNQEFEALRAECVQLSRSHPAAYSRVNGPVHETRVGAQEIDPAENPNLRRFLENERLRKLFEAAERRPIDNLRQFAKIEHLKLESDGGHDHQNELHSDIFFNSHKAWLYLTDVHLKTGPLAFIKGTHHLTMGRLRHVYRHSVGMKEGVDPSRRIEPEEMAVLPEETKIVCPANTLVIANTCGYHRRVPGEAGQERLSIHLEVRHHPFRWKRKRAPQ